MRAHYCGRFAPSPTGPLHLGSLVAALASFLDARHCGGRWLLRIEDIDPPREVAGAAEAICTSLRRHGLHWDGDVLMQSTRYDIYRQSLDGLRAQGRVFDCVCTRAVLGPGGSCGRRCTPGTDERRAVRLELPARLAPYDDVFYGRQTPVEAQRDVVVWRKDGLPAYALAVTVDDSAQDIDHVLRGADLLSETPLQRFLIAQLGGAPPTYGHVPIVRGDDGRKLSKQNGARGLDDRQVLTNLRDALRLLEQRSASARAGTPEQLLSIAIDAWDPQALARAAVDS